MDCGRSSVVGLRRVAGSRGASAPIALAPNPCSRQVRENVRISNRRTRRARIVNTSSGSGLFGNFGQANYSSAKGGIASLTALTAIELARYGITANAIAPVGKTRPISEDPEALKLKDGFDPLDPANVSPLVTWLVSEKSRDVTGRIFSAVGGYVGLVEGYFRGPGMQHERKLTFADIDAELPAVIAQSRPRTNVHESHPYLKGA